MENIIAALIGALAVIIAALIGAVGVKWKRKLSTDESGPGDLIKRERRILRALVDEDAGRHIRSYQRSKEYYGPAIENLKSHKYIELTETGYRLTNKGKKEAAQYLEKVLERYRRETERSG